MKCFDSIKEKYNHVFQIIIIIINITQISHAKSLVFRYTTQFIIVMPVHGFIHDG